MDPLIAGLHAIVGDRHCVIELQHRKPPAELDLMRRIKRLVDPDDLMNPGKLV